MFVNVRADCTYNDDHCAPTVLSVLLFLSFFLCIDFFYRPRTFTFTSLFRAVYRNARALGHENDTVNSLAPRFTHILLALRTFRGERKWEDQFFRSLSLSPYPCLALSIAWRQMNKRESWIAAAIECFTLSSPRFAISRQSPEARGRLCNALFRPVWKEWRRGRKIV